MRCPRARRSPGSLTTGAGAGCHPPGRDLGPGSPGAAGPAAWRVQWHCESPIHRLPGPRPGPGPTTRPAPGSRGPAARGASRKGPCCRSVQPPTGSPGLHRSTPRHRRRRGQTNSPVPLHRPQRSASPALGSVARRGTAATTAGLTVVVDLLHSRNSNDRGCSNRGFFGDRNRTAAGARPSAACAGRSLVCGSG